MKMNSAYPLGGSGDGIFTDLQQYDVPWKNDNISQQLDILYFSNSGEKTCSNMILNRINDEGFRNIIANSLFVMFSVKWQKLFNTLTFDYNPIENYRMVESENIINHGESKNTDGGTVKNESETVETDTGTIKNERTETDTDTGTLSINETDTKTDEGTILNSSSSNVDDSIYGFNSSSSVKSQESDATNNNTETRNLEIKDNKTNTETHDLTKEATIEDDETRNLERGETSTNTETRNLSTSMENDGTQERELTRSGNIGVTTSQQMISSERDLWDWNYFNIVFRDIDSVLCLDVYDY